MAGSCPVLPVFLFSGPRINIVLIISLQPSTSSRGHDMWLRVNQVGGKIHEEPINPTYFHFHPDAGHDPTDVAVCPVTLKAVDSDTGETAEMDATCIPLNGPHSLAPTEEFEKESMGRGGTISIVGLFRSHFGENKNIPIVRIGNISMLPDEPVRTPMGFLKAYLVEARSIAGLSGSPVFAHMDPTLAAFKGLRSKKLANPVALMGLMHGHFDVPNLNEDVVTDEDAPTSGVHTGIGVVLPVHKIIETINHPDLVALRKKNFPMIDQEGADDRRNPRPEEPHCV
jgi:hypothetical protein